MYNNIAIIGSNGAIGQALLKALAALAPEATIHAFSRHPQGLETPQVSYYGIDYSDERSIEKAATIASAQAALDLVVVSIGILHDGVVQPEKSLRDLSGDKFQEVFAINTIAPAIIAKYFLPKLGAQRKSIFASLSARVGSISDNRLGGWYAYRASKAALNMIIKTASIEMARRNPHAVVVGLHPGTVNSALSKPFQDNLPSDKLFEPEVCAEHLLSVLASLTAEQSGKCFAWDGTEVSP